MLNDARNVNRAGLWTPNQGAGVRVGQAVNQQPARSLATRPTSTPSQRGGLLQRLAGGTTAGSTTLRAPALWAERRAQRSVRSISALWLAELLGATLEMCWPEAVAGGWSLAVLQLEAALCEQLAFGALPILNNRLSGHVNRIILSLT